MRLLLLLLLACLSIVGCGDSGSDLPQVAPPEVSNLEFRFLLNRAVPADVTEIRFTGFDANEILGFGDVTHPRAAVVRLREVPSGTAFLTIEYLTGEKVLGRGAIPVQLVPGETTIVEDPPFEEVEPQALGVNFNGLLDNIDLSDLERTRTRWIRCFVDYFEWQQNPSSFEPGFDKLQQAHQAGYKTIVNVKFNFEGGKLFPTGPLETEQILQDVPALLDRFYPDCDILVIGNEPFIESQQGAQRGEPLIAFYQAAAFKIKGFWDRQPRQVPLYLGAYDSIWKPDWQQEAIPLLEFTRKHRWLRGADLHLHQNADVDIDEAFRFVKPRLRKDQTLLITEFSQVNYYLEFNQDFIPASLIFTYGRPDDWFVYNYLNYALKNPVSLEEWTTFLKDSAWFESKKEYLNVAWGKFKNNPQVSVATYGIYQSGPSEFQPGDQPWILNALFANQTVVLDPVAQPNYPFFDQFLAIQAELNERQAPRPRLKVRSQ